MIVALLSDVHANLPALEVFVRITKGLADSYVCLGDMVNYGPWNDECLELIHSLTNLVLLEGNHERLFLGLDAIENEAPLVQEFYDHSFRRFRRKDLITGLPASHRLGSFICTHTIDNQKIYSDTDLQVSDSYIIGHTHRQFHVQRSGKHILNCGSVGQNRAYIDAVNCALYDTCSGRITLCEETYPMHHFMRELSVRGYSKRCIEYYLRKERRMATGTRKYCVEFVTDEGK